MITPDQTPACYEANNDRHTPAPPPVCLITTRGLPVEQSPPQQSEQPSRAQEQILRNQTGRKAETVP